LTHVCGLREGGFAPTGTNSAGFAVCGNKSTNIGGASVTDYSPHHEPFQYYKSRSSAGNPRAAKGGRDRERAVAAARAFPDGTGHGSFGIKRFIKLRL
jgi:hypothetical protein